MTASGAWFESIVPERPTLLLVDEPPDETILQQLSEQLGGHVGRTANWKIAVSVRSPKDPVLRFLFGPRMKPRVQELALHRLPQTDAEKMCFELLRTGRLATLPEDRHRDAARELSRRFSQHPVWLTLAVHVLEDRADLAQVPATAKDLANEYLSEIERSQSESPPEAVRDLFRWVALLGTGNREDDATIQLLAEATGAGGPTDVRSKLAKLVDRRVLVQRGARSRYVELKPDVLRDHVLLSWLSVDTGFGTDPIVASDDAKALIESVRVPAVAGTLSRLGRSILVSLARTEFLLNLSGTNVHLMAIFFEALQAAVPTMTASQRLALADMLEAIAVFQPIPTAGVIESMRRFGAPDEEMEAIFGPRVVGQNDVLLSLAWPLFHAAMGAQSLEAQETVLRELCAVAETEAEIVPQLKVGLPNDGKRGAALIKRVLEGGPQFWSDFDDTAKKLGGELLDRIAQSAPTPGDQALLEALVQPAMAVERRQTWSDDHVIHIQTIVIGPEHPGWSTRSELLSRTKQALSSEATPRASRVALWRVLAEAHRNINQVCRREEPRDLHCYDALLSDLVWAKELLQHRSASVEELSAARGLWRWHHRFESDIQLKAVSDQLEALYASNDLAAEFDPLLSRDDWEQRWPRASAKAAELASASTPEEIAGFIDRAIAFLGTEEKLYELMAVAGELGTHAEANDAIRVFVKQSLGQAQVSARSDFGAVAAASWIVNVRNGDHPERTHLLVADLMATCGSDDQRANLLLRIYGNVPNPRDSGAFTAEEHALLRSQKELFVATGRAVFFVPAIAATLDYEWPTARGLLEDVLRTLPPSDRSRAFRGLVDAISWASDPARLPPELSEWLLNQLLLVPDLDDPGGHIEWHLEKILKRVGRVHVGWLPGALDVRRDLEAKEETGARAVSHGDRISKYVRPIAATDVGDGTVSTAIDGLLEFVTDNGSVGYSLPEVLRDVDPEGLVVPGIVAVRLASAADDQIRRLTRTSGAYAVGSVPWRTIAKAAIVAARTQGLDVRRSVFSSLRDRGLRTWSGRPGEVPRIFVAAVNEAKAALEAETDVELRPFWEWQLTIAEAELHEEEERAKEERGE